MDLLDFGNNTGRRRVVLILLFLTSFLLSGFLIFHDGDLRKRAEKIKKKRELAFKLKKPLLEWKDNDTVSITLFRSRTKKKVRQNTSETEIKEVDQKANDIMLDEGMD